MSNLYYRLPLLNLPFPGKAPLMWIAPINSTILEEQPPYCYIQQVTMRVAVMPWDRDMKLGDAFRGPLYEVFKVLEVIRNYQDDNRYAGNKKCFFFGNKIILISVQKH